jgi:transcriptional regulatory protein LevR
VLYGYRDLFVDKENSMPLIEVRQNGIDELTRQNKSKYTKQIFFDRLQRENPLLYDVFSQFKEKINPLHLNVAISTAHLIYMSLSLQTELDEEEMERELGT